MFAEVGIVDNEGYFKECIYVNLDQISYFSPASLELHMISGDVFKLEKYSSEILLDMVKKEAIDE